MVNSDNKHSGDDFKYRANLAITSKCTNSNFIMAHDDDSYPLSNHLTNTHKSTNFIMFHQNIRGLTHKIDEFLISLSCINPQVLCVTEHHLRPDEINNIHLGQYTLGTYFCRRIYKHGGVSIFVSKNIRFQETDLSQYVKEKDFEVCALNLQVASIHLLIICLYRSPTGDYTYFLNQLELVLNKLYRVSTNIIVCGDFNINFLKTT